MGSFQVLEVFDLIDYDEFHLPKSNTNDDQGQNFTIGNSNILNLRANKSEYGTLWQKDSVEATLVVHQAEGD